MPQLDPNKVRALLARWEPGENVDDDALISGVVSHLFDSASPPPELCRMKRPVIVVLSPEGGPDRDWNGNQFIANQEGALVIDLDSDQPGRSAIHVAVADLAAGRITFIPSLTED